MSSCPVLVSKEQRRTSALETAMEFARQGHYVFPLAKGTKRPVLKQSWIDISSNDPVLIQAWAGQHPQCNWAVDCGKSGLAVIDIDVRDGKPGMTSWEEVCAFRGPLPETYQVQTPSGGLHIYFRGEIATSAQTKLGAGVDTRGKGGYIVLPGSKLDTDKLPYIVTNGAEVALLPHWLKSMVRDKSVPLEPLTGDGGISRLRDADVLERARGDEKFQLLLRGDWEGDFPSQSEADMALCTKLAFYTGKDFVQMDRLFRKSGLYREKWERDDYRDGTLQKSVVLQAEMHPAQHDLKDVFGPTAQGYEGFYDRAPVNGNTLGVCEPPPRQWLINGKGGLPRNVVGCIAGQGGCGKTLFALQLAASIASGVDCLGGAFQLAQSGPVLMALAEDDMDEVDRRMFRIRSEIGVGTLDALHVWPRGGDARLVERNIKGGLVESAGYKALCRKVAEVKPALVVLDSLSVVAGEAEMSNPDGAYVVSLLGRICDICECTVLFLTHVSKASLASKAGAGHAVSGEKAMDSALDPLSTRGASALVNNCRWVMTATLVPKSERRKMNAEDKQLVAYAVRKTNYSAPLDSAYLENKSGHLVPFIDERKGPDDDSHKEYLLELLGHKKLAKTAFILACAQDFELPSRNECRRLVEELVVEGRIAEEKKSGRGGGVLLHKVHQEIPSPLC